MAKEPGVAVLLVASDEDLALAFRTCLRSRDPGAPARLAHVRSAADARARVEHEDFDLIVVDGGLDVADGGLELVRQLRGAGVATPIVLLTARGGEDVAVEALRAGATDYLATTSLDPESLQRSMRYSLDLARQAELRRRAEEALRLREEQLRGAERLDTVATLSNGIAHEFNNLLNVVTGYADMIRRRLPPGDPMHRHVEHILQASEKAAGLTRQLTAFSRSQVLQPSVLDAAALVNDIAPVVRSVVGRRIEVTTRAADSAGRVKADRAQIDQALMSLVVNAKDAMPDGGRLAIAAAFADVDGSSGLGDDPGVRRGRYVTLSVCDTGVGMSAEVRARAFEPFFTTKGRANATGLGLSTVHGTIRQSGGHVRLESEPGRGTTVTIYLPLVDGAGNPMQLEPDGTPGREVVLLVDDDASMREALAESLRGMGYSVLEAAGGEEALRVAAGAQCRIDVLLTDVMMPGLDGPELATRLRAARPQTRLVFMSGATQEALRHRGHADAPFLWKPFRVEELAEAIRTALGSRP